MLINISGNKSIIDIVFPQPLYLEEGKICLSSSSIWYSWHNFKNNFIKYFNGNEWIAFNFYDGMYDDDDIIEAIKDLPFKLSVNKVMCKFVLKIPEKHKIDFSEGYLNEILGFDKIIYNQGKYIAPFQPDISRGVDRILIHCSIVEGSYSSNDGLSARKSEVLHSFIPNVSAGSLIVIQPFSPIYLQTNTKIVERIRIKLTDQRSRDIDLNGENVTYILELK